MSKYKVTTRRSAEGRIITNSEIPPGLPSKNVLDCVEHIKCSDTAVFQDIGVELRLYNVKLPIPVNIYENPLMQYVKGLVVECSHTSPPTDLEVFIDVESQLQFYNVIPPGPSRPDQPACSKAKIIIASELYAGENSLYHRTQIINSFGPPPTRLVGKDAYILTEYSQQHFTRTRYFYYHGEWRVATISSLNHAILMSHFESTFDTRLLTKQNVYVFDVASNNNVALFLFRFCLSDKMTYAPEHTIRTSASRRLIMKPLQVLSSDATPLIDLIDAIDDGIGVTIMDGSTVYTLFKDPSFSSMPYEDLILESPREINNLKSWFENGDQQTKMFNSHIQNKRSVITWSPLYICDK